MAGEASRLVQKQRQWQQPDLSMAGRITISSSALLAARKLLRAGIAAEERLTLAIEVLHAKVEQHDGSSVVDGCTSAGGRNEWRRGYA